MIVGLKDGKTVGEEKGVIVRFDVGMVVRIGDGEIECNGVNVIEAAVVG